MDLLRAAATDSGLVVRGSVVPDVLTPDAWRHAHETGWLTRVARNVSRLPDSRRDDQETIASAVLAAGRGAVAGGRTAAFLLGASVSGIDPVHVVVRGRRQIRPLPGVVFHRPRNLIDLVEAEGLAISTCRPTRALLDVAAWDPRLTSNVLEDFVVKGVLQISDAQAAVRRFSRQGRPGLKVLRATVDAWALGSRPPESVLEERMAKLCRDHGLPPFEFQRPVGRYRPDFCRVVEKVIVECDGQRKYIENRSLAEHDRERDAELTADGWAILRFTWHQINKRSAWVASQIRKTLRTRAALLAR